ncbi:hypothetical protein EMCRGX_G008720 [Ephydatia muelleri]
MHCCWPFWYADTTSHWCLLCASTLSTLKHLINPHLAAGKAPKEASHFLAGATLVALPTLKPNCPPDIRPIAVGEVLRQLTEKGLCHLLKNKAMEFFLPYQFDVACLNGVEKVIHTVRQCLDNHWTDDHFVYSKLISAMLSTLSLDNRF